MTSEKNRRILIIDDNRAIHDDFRKILVEDTSSTARLDASEERLFGSPTLAVQHPLFQVDSAYQGQEGVLLVERALEAGRPYALAFVDVRMPPGLDGVETTQKIWAIDPEIQIVICTAYSDYSWNEMLEKIGHCDGLLILKKPFDTVEALQLALALTEKWWLHLQSRQKMEELESMVAGRTLELQQTNRTLQTEVAEHMQARAELEWKTSLLEAQTNSSLDGILVVDEHGKKILQNQRTSGLLRIPPHIAEDNDNGPQLRWVADMTKNPGQFFEKVVYLNSHPDEISRDEVELKDETTLERYSAPVVGKDGKYYGRIWTFRDITERKQTEELLRESEEKFRQLADNITDVFWICSPDFATMHYISPGYELIWGRSMESLYANPHQWIEAILPEERERAFAAFAPIMGNEAKMSVEYQIARPDGTTRWIHDRGFQVRDATGKLVRLAGIASDITERKQTEESLRLLGSAVDQSKESIMITNAELDLPGPRIIFVNPAFTQMTGYNEEDAIGKTPRILQGPRTDRTVLSRLRQNLEHGQVFAGEAINYRKDGKEFNLEWQIAPIRNVGGKITHFVAIQHDITGRKQLEARLFQSQKMETVGKLAGGIAHEFNSILTAIIGQSELLLNDLPGPSPLVKSVTEIHKAAERAATLTRQLLAYGRKQILQPENLDLNVVIAGMENTLLHLMGRSVEVRFSPDAGLKSVKADAGQIEQVIVNIAMNAAEAMPNGGKLMVETANIMLDTDYVASFPELKAGKYVMLAIGDTGAGMSDEIKARVFEPFFTTKGVGKGTGLGLATCHGIVKQSGGHISVYSEPGRGTTFKIYLPQIETQEKIPIQRLDTPDLPRGTATILLVEDDPALRDMATTLLRRLGYTVLSAADGIEALTLKQQRGIGHVDLLFTDVVMPHMSGKELADRVRALYPHTKILFTSAYTENEIVHQGVLDKGVALLQKPFTPSALARKLWEMLDQTPKN
jgi:two-component system cell cycle sensor histidine kinase/response regulator CckA